MKLSLSAIATPLQPQGALLFRQRLQSGGGVELESVDHCVVTRQETDLVKAARTRMLALDATTAGLALARGMASANPLARLPATRLD